MLAMLGNKMISSSMKLGVWPLFRDTEVSLQGLLLTILNIKGIASAMYIPHGVGV
jgi:hypothetical protein